MYKNYTPVINYLIVRFTFIYYLGIYRNFKKFVIYLFKNHLNKLNRISKYGSKK